MKLLFDFFPIVIFFLAYKFAGIYAATGAFIIAACIQMGYYWFRHGRVEKIHLITFILGIILGGATLLLHNELFIKWKPTAIYWAFSLAFLISQWLGKKPLLQTMMADNIKLPPMIWTRLNISWALFFAFMGIINLYVVYHCNTNTWVNFKLFGTLGLLLAFVLLQGIYLSKYLRADNHSL